MGGVADKLEGLELLSADGGAVRLGDLWREGPAILVFIRHFG